MSSVTWACFDCRMTVRRPGAQPARCPGCGAACENLGVKIPVPSKRDAKGWEKVRLHLLAVRRRRERQIKEAYESSRRHLTEQIAKLQALPPNPGRLKSLALLRRKL